MTANEPCDSTFRRSLRELKLRTGIVIPVYLPAAARTASATLLRDTVVGCLEQVDDPGNICLGVDGDENGADVAHELSEAYGVSVTVSPVNRGKLQGARAGIASLLASQELTYLAVLDCDSDHFPNELLNFVRMAEHIIDQTDDDRVFVLGRRISPHRAMGLLRGELEGMADRLLLNALEYHAAISGTPMRLEYATLFEGAPDFHSGYKLFSRRTAEEVFLSEPQTAGLSETVYYRHAVEAVMVVEGILAGARMGVINRSTYNRQPVTAYGLLNRALLTANMIIWPCKRLGVPGGFVQQWLENALPAMQLGTLVPEGKQELAATARLVLEAFDIEPGPQLPTKAPLFV
ncbi:MAG: hypothetical protein ACP5HS_00850 [Anaerolineae bacterium]